MSRKKKARKQALAAARAQEKPLDATERKVQKSRERRFAECMDLSQKLISHIPKEHSAHQQQLLDCSIWCNQTRPAVLDRSISIPEQGRTFNYTLIPEANIPNKVSLIHNDNLEEEDDEGNEPDAVAEPIHEGEGGEGGSQ